MGDNDPVLPRRILAGSTVSRLRRHTDARIALGQAGNGQPTSAVLRFALDHARARDAIRSDLSVADLSRQLADGDWPLHVTSAASSRDIYLTRPDLGRILSQAGQDTLADAPRCDLVLAVADGLSALAVNQNAVPLIAALRPLLPPDMKVGLVLVSNGRVAIGDKIAAALGAEAVLILIGERPGLSASDSLGAYLTWKPSVDTTDANRFCVSNIRSGGLLPHKAAEQISTLLIRSRKEGRSGVAKALDGPANRPCI